MSSTAKDQKKSRRHDDRPSKGHVVIENVYKSFGDVRVLEGVSLDIKPGEVAAKTQRGIDVARLGVDDRQEPVRIACAHRVRAG